MARNLLTPVTGIGTLSGTMTDESLDAFGGAATVRTRSASRITTEVLNDPEQQTERDAALPLPMAFVYPSRTGGLPHIVSVIDDPHGQRLGCTCKSAAVRNYCWAIDAARKLLGWPEPDEE